MGGINYISIFDLSLKKTFKEFNEFVKPKQFNKAFKA